MKEPINDRATVQIDYPGSKEKKFLTLGQLKEYLKGEDPDYLKKFFEMLEGNGSVYGRIAKYTLLKNDPVK